MRAPDEEECDDGNLDDGDGCSSTCALEGSATCGDGIIEGDEECDLGSGDADDGDGDGCESDCTTELTYACVEEPSQCVQICASATWYEGLASETTEYVHCAAGLFSEADAYCDRLGDDWYLTTISSSTEQSKVHGIVTDFSDFNSWIGLHDRFTNNTYEWVSGESVAYDNWNGSPDTPSSARNDCVGVKRGNGYWRSFECNVDKTYICEGPAICGNGVMGNPEECDDGDTDAGDGCDPSCQAESNYECTVATEGSPSVCTTPSHAVLAKMGLVRDGAQTKLAWQASSEDGTLGYRVLHRTSDEDAWSQVQDGMVLRDPSYTSGGRYAVSVPRPFGQYRLLEVLPSGEDFVLANEFVLADEEPRGTESILPRLDAFYLGLAASAAATVAPPKGVGQRTSGVSKLTASLIQPGQLQARISDATAGSSVSYARLTGSPQGVVIGVVNPGVQAIDVTDLAVALEVTPEEVQQAAAGGRLSLRHRDARDVGWRYDAPRQRLLFGVRATETSAGPYRAYVLRLQQGEAKQRTRVVSQVGDAASEGGIQQVLEENNFAGLVLNPNPDGDIWGWKVLANTSPESSQLLLEREVDVLPVGDVQVSLHLLGSWGKGHERKVELTVNARAVGEAAVTEDREEMLRFIVPRGVLHAGRNTIGFTWRSSVSPGRTGAYVDRAELNYEGALRTAGQELEFEALGDGETTVEVSGAQAQVYDLDAAGEVVSRSVAGEGSVRLTFVAEKSHHYLVGEPEVVRRPSVRPYRKRDLRKAEGVEYLVVTSGELRSAGEELVRHRRGQGLSARLVEMMDVYDSFSGGEASPAAVRQLLGAWRPRYVVLLGSGTYDSRGYTEAGPGHVPVKLVRTPHGLYASDSWYGDVDGDGISDVAIGRVPAQTAAEAEAYTDAVVGYEKELGGRRWQTDAMLVGDKDASGYYSEVNRRVLGKLPVGVVARLTLADRVGVEQTREDVLRQWQSGVRWLNYSGHGGIDGFGKKQPILSRADMGELRASTKRPIVTAMTCAVSRFEVPGARAWSEQALFAEGGAIAVWGPTGLTYPYQTLPLSEAFAEGLFGATGATRIGDVVAHAAQESMDEAPEHLRSVMVLLGDPALLVGRAQLRTEGEVTEPEAPRTEAVHAADEAEGGGCTVLADADADADAKVLPWMLGGAWLVWRRRRS